ncbi:MAG: hypothetical protein QNJ12_03175 [Ilumatobacter sp.]|nr:hypothetical protein [Ilumatobacter sp.]MDJ0767762.1 hypothetical protein [Ilumatobacter sp.]
MSETPSRSPRGLHRAAADGDDFESISERWLAPARHRSWYGSFQAVEDADDWRHLTLLVSEPFDPVSSLSRIECPFLATYGGRDPLLPPWRGAEQSGVALVDAGNVDATIIVFPDGDHRMRASGADEFVPGYLNLVGDWTARRAHRPPPTEHA